MAASTLAAARALGEVAVIAQATAVSSAAALKAAEEVDRTAETLSSEVQDFVATMANGNEADRRQYERIPGNGPRVGLQLPVQKSVQASIADISRGGTCIMHACGDAPGAPVQITLGDGAWLEGRVARHADGSRGKAPDRPRPLSSVFRQIRNKLIDNERPQPGRQVIPGQCRIQPVCPHCDVVEAATRIGRRRGRAVIQAVECRSRHPRFLVRGQNACPGAQGQRR